MKLLAFIWPACNAIASAVILFLLVFRCRGKWSWLLAEDKASRSAVLFGLYFAFYTLFRSIITLTSRSPSGVELIAAAECSVTLLIFVPLLKTLARRVQHD